MAAWMFLLSLIVPHLNLSIMCVSYIEFYIETEIIFCQCMFPYTHHAKFDYFTLLFGQGQAQHKQSSKH